MSERRYNGEVVSHLIIHSHFITSVVVCVAPVSESTPITFIFFLPAVPALSNKAKLTLRAPHY